MATEMTTTEETETTETVTSEDGRALAREDVRSDVARSVAERDCSVSSIVRVARARIEQADNRDVRGDGDVFDERGRRALAREDVSGDVARSVAERGDYAVSSGCTSGAGTGSSKQTTETSEETETFCRGDERGRGEPWHEDVSGDVARSVAERGDYAVSSGCTSGAGTDRASRQPRRPRRRRRFVEGTTTEMATEMTTTEETETTETVTSEDVRALAREDVSGDVARSG
ncbi:hypothetical protein GN244_ATG19606 [Phytophthora infestans]|uniref:Uncharacterized protein n=1 Tax=Phytophthora infestans TaxID=4787 RepID=A0A833RNG4_PHYIN|nr:hypothetical protein GN244_ATG19606 [Phytophthora infestans]